MSDKSKKPVADLSDDGTVLSVDGRRAKLDHLVIEDDGTYTAFVTLKVAGLRQVRLNLGGGRP